MPSMATPTYTAIVRRISTTSSDANAAAAGLDILGRHPRIVTAFRSDEGPNQIRDGNFRVWPLDRSGESSPDALRMPQDPRVGSSFEDGESFWSSDDGARLFEFA
jgi:hypothetical protein